MSQRTYHDPLHRGIGLDRHAPAEGMVMDLVDTAPFQRLRRIRQLGRPTSHSTVPNPVGSPTP